MKRLLTLLLTLLLLLLPVCLPAQDRDERVDSLVSLLSAKRLIQTEVSGVPYRKVIGPARFLHNNTYLLCDSAMWNLNTDIIDAVGNVKILQNETVLTGDSLKYLINQDLAQFRGHLVELQDKDRNVLRTRFLDYNTKDSVAIFQKGGAMRDKDGQIIESVNGRYDSKLKLFTFSDNVNMFTDSIFVKTTRLEYLSNASLAVFGRSTNAWKDDNMLSSEAGWYRREDELFLFYDNVHGMSPDKEGWADSLYFHRLTSDIEMLGNVQLSDSLRKVDALAGRVEYVDSLMRITMTRDAAIAGVTDTTGTARDTVWAGADKFVYRTRYLGDIPGKAASSQKRLDDLSSDAIAEYREKQAEAAREAAKKAQEEKEERERPGLKRQNARQADPPPEKEGETPEAPPALSGDSRAAADSLSGVSSVSTVSADSLVSALSDSLSVSPDSLASAMSDGLSVPPDTLSGSLSMPSDSLSVSVDSLAAAVDSTRIGFLTAVGNFRLYRDDIQIACDSLEYTDLDSLVRLYDRPLIWNEGNRQYTADSILAVVSGGSLQKANLLSNAFIIIKEDSLRYDQIRAAEMMAYFAEGGGLSRFDGLGGADAIFYIKEDSTLATVSKTQSKLLTATFHDGNLDKVYYYDKAQIDAYPMAQMHEEDRQLKGFDWHPAGQPLSPRDITSRKIRPGRRREYARRPRATFVQTNIYFPGYISGIYCEIEAREDAARERARLSRIAADSLSVPADSLTALDSLQEIAADSTLTSLRDTSSLAVPDSTGRGASSLTDSLGRFVADSPELPPVDSLDARVHDPKAAKRAEREAKKKEQEQKEALRLAAREEKWARLDSLDARKAAVKAEKKAVKLRKKKMAALKRQQRQDEKDRRRLEKYIERYRKKEEK